MDKELKLMLLGLLIGFVIFILIILISRFLFCCVRKDNKVRLFWEKHVVTSIDLEDPNR